MAMNISNYLRLRMFIFLAYKKKIKSCTIRNSVQLKDGVNRVLFIITFDNRLSVVFGNRQSLIISISLDKM